MCVQRRSRGTSTRPSLCLQPPPTTASAAPACRQRRRQASPPPQLQHFVLAAAGHGAAVRAPVHAAGGGGGGAGGQSQAGGGSGSGSGTKHPRLPLHLYSPDGGRRRRVYPALPTPPLPDAHLNTSSACPGRSIKSFLLRRSHTCRGMEREREREDTQCRRSGDVDGHGCRGLSRAGAAPDQPRHVALDPLRHPHASGPAPPRRALSVESFEPEAKRRESADQATCIGGEGGPDG